jgi:DNA-directed RNA polymerase subunit RPC12/RpoP
MIEFNCTGCAAKLEVADNQAGGKTVCPRCKRVLQVPGGDGIPHFGVQCNHCGAELQFEESLGGTMQRCPQCGAMVMVPEWGGKGEGGQGCLGLTGMIVLALATGLFGATMLVRG